MGRAVETLHTLDGIPGTEELRREIEYYAVHACLGLWTKDTHTLYWSIETLEKVTCPHHCINFHPLKVTFVTSYQKALSAYNGSK